MKCNNCGYELNANDMFCPNCGTQIQRRGENEVQQSDKMFNYEQQPINSYVDDNQSQNYSQQNNYGQTNNYGQASNYSYQNEYTEQYNKNEGNGNLIRICIIIVVTVAIIAAIVVGSYAIISSINKKNNTNNNTNSGNTGAISNTSTETSTGSTNGTNTATTTTTTTTSTMNNNNTIPQTTAQQNTSTYKVNFKGFKLYIPDNLIYYTDVATNNLEIADSKFTWVAEFGISEGSFQQLKNKKNNIKTNILEKSSAGTTVSDPRVENIGGVEFVILEISSAGENALVAYAELNSMNIACMLIQNDNNDFDKNVLNNFTSIIKTAEYTGESKNMETKGKIKLEDINKSLKKIIKEK